MSSDNSRSQSGEMGEQLGASSTTNVPTLKSDISNPIPPAAQSLSEALEQLDLANPSYDACAKASIAALVSPCFLHRRFDDAVNLEKVLDDIGYDESMSHSKLVQTATGVREISKQLQRRPIKRAVRNVMIITKARDNRLVHVTRRLTEWLMKTPRYNSPVGVNVYVDEKLRHSNRFDAQGLVQQNERFSRMLRYWTPTLCSTTPEKFDLVLTLGGDGTVLYTSWLFQRIVPPILSFSLGSLGFLTPFDFDRYQDHLDRVMGGIAAPQTPIRSTDNLSNLPMHRENMFSSKPSGVSVAATGTSTPNSTAVSDIIQDAGMRVSLRMRFTCTVFRSNLTASSAASSRRPSPAPAPTEECQFEVLNELVIDRGPSPYVSNLELYGDDSLLTVIQADGIIFSTPTGSTAYSLSAGGSLVHPSIPAILLTPICPHTLSFRPMLLNDTMSLRIAVPRGSRAGAWCSFDGKGRIELRQGDYVNIRASCYPFAAVVGSHEGWIDSVSRTLRWNTREARQKGWNGGGRNKLETSGAMYTSHGDDVGIIGWDHDAVEQEDSMDEDGDEEEENFDIDFDDDDGVNEGIPPSKDSGYGGDDSASTSPAHADSGKSMETATQAKLGNLSI